MKEILTNYTNYNLWANTKLLNLLKEIDAARLDKELKSSFQSINKTVCHIWGAEDIWHQRLNGIEKPTAAGFNYSRDAIKAIDSALKMSAMFNKFVESKDESYFQTYQSYKDLKGNSHSNPHWQIIMHCMNHSTYHRGQIVTMLREVGITTIPSTDMMGYFREAK